MGSLVPETEIVRAENARVGDPPRGARVCLARGFAWRTCVGRQGHRIIDLIMDLTPRALRVDTRADRPARSLQSKDLLGPEGQQMCEHGTGTESAEANEEIEITPEMIGAGVVELARFDPLEDSFEEAAELIFRAMYAADRQRDFLDRNIAKIDSLDRPTDGQP